VQAGRSNPTRAWRDPVRPASRGTGPPARVVPGRALRPAQPLPVSGGANHTPARAEASTTAKIAPKDGKIKRDAVNVGWVHPADRKHRTRDEPIADKTSRKEADA
jgi:hypothetical protein